MASKRTALLAATTATALAAGGVVVVDDLRLRSQLRTVQEDVDDQVTQRVAMAQAEALGRALDKRGVAFCPTGPESGFGVRVLDEQTSVVAVTPIESTISDFTITNLGTGATAVPRSTRFPSSS